MGKIKIADVEVDAEYQIKLLELISTVFKEVSELADAVKVSREAVLLELFANVTDIILAEDVFVRMMSSKNITDKQIMELVMSANLRPIAKKILLHALIDERPSLKSYITEEYKDVF